MDKYILHSPKNIKTFFARNLKKESTQNIFYYEEQ